MKASERAQFDSKALGNSLRLITLYRDVAHKELADSSGLTTNTVHHIMGGKGLSFARYESVAQALGCKDCSEALAFGRYVEYALQYSEYMPEIIKAYREHTADLSGRKFSTYIFKGALETTAIELSRLETRKIPGEKVCCHILHRLGFKTMHEMVKAAGLEKKFPDPGYSGPVPQWPKPSTLSLPPERDWCTYLASRSSRGMPSPA